MLSSFFGGKKPPPVPTRRTAVHKPQVKTISSPTVNVVSTLPEYSQYADVPKFIKVISGSAQSQIPFSDTSLQNQLVAINTTGNEVVIIVTKEIVKSSQLQSIRGAIVQAGYIVLSVATANQALIKSILEGSIGAQKTRSTSSNNEFAREIDEWVRYAVRNDATDIHMKCMGSSALIRYRVHGELVRMETGKKGVYSADFVANSIATLYNNFQQSNSGSKSIYEPKEFVSCMIPHSVDNKGFRLRFQNIVGQDGPAATCRLLPEDDTRATPTFKELGYAPSHIHLWESATDTPTGAIVIAGITGSGKSTTMKSFIELNPDLDKLAVYTIEDPVEYRINGAVQIPIQRDLNDKKGSSAKFNTAVASLMRADPDIGALGELRDHDTANAMQQLAESGHMSIGTVHANQLSGIVPRLINSEIGMNRDTLSNPKLLTLLAYQALVPVLCPSCAFSFRNLPDDVSVLRLIQAYKDIEINVSGFRWKNPMGCSHCKNRGTIGVTVVAEMLMPDPDWLKFIREGRDWDALAHYMSFSDDKYDSPNMDGKSVYHHTLYKASLGTVDARQCQRFSNLKQFLDEHKMRQSLRTPRRVA